MLRGSHFLVFTSKTRAPPRSAHTSLRCVPERLSDLRSGGGKLALRSRKVERSGSRTPRTPLPLRKGGSPNKALSVSATSKKGSARKRETKHDPIIHVFQFETECAAAYSPALDRSDE